MVLRGWIQTGPKVSEFVIVISFKTTKKLIQAPTSVNEEDDADCMNEHGGGHMRVGPCVF